LLGEDNTYPAMRVIVLFLAWLVCAGHGRRTRTAHAHQKAGAYERGPVAFAEFLAALNPAAGWKVTHEAHGLAVRDLRGKSARSRSVCLQASQPGHTVMSPVQEAVREDCVEVYDNVLSEEACSKLEELGSGVYHRSNGPRSAVEGFIESVLRSLGDPTEEVEYWCRYDWEPVEVHRDSDEDVALDLGIQRFPSASHVAYIDVEPDLRAPTLLWSSGVEASSHGTLVVVPAVKGRLLRFRGDLLHGVPRPVTQLLGEVDPDPAKLYARKVLVFNSWPNGAPVDDFTSEDDFGVDASQAWEEVAGCQSKDTWQKLGIVKCSAEDRKGGSPQTELRSRTFGSHDLFVTTAHAPHEVVADVLQEPHSASQLSLDAFLDDPALGVPSQDRYFEVALDEDGNVVSQMHPE